MCNQYISKILGADEDGQGPYRVPLAFLSLRKFGEPETCFDSFVRGQDPKEYFEYIGDLVETKEGSTSRYCSVYCTACGNVYTLIEREHEDEDGEMSFGEFCRTEERPLVEALDKDNGLFIEKTLVYTAVNILSSTKEVTDMCDRILQSVFQTSPQTAGRFVDVKNRVTAEADALLHTKHFEAPFSRGCGCSGCST